MIGLQKADPVKIIRRRPAFHYLFQASVGIFFIFSAASAKLFPEYGEIAVQILAHALRLVPHAGKNRRLFFIIFISLSA